MPTNPYYAAGLLKDADATTAACSFLRKVMPNELGELLRKGQKAGCLAMECHRAALGAEDPELRASLRTASEEARNAMKDVNRHLAQAIARRAAEVHEACTRSA